jgi:hypothetical protein
MRETATRTDTNDVNGTRLIPNDLFREADTFGVGSQTTVLGSTIATTKASIRRAERRAPKLLRHHKAEFGRQSSSRSRGNV